MRVVAIVQARMNSERLPGKVLMDVEGVPLAARVIRRVRRATAIDAVVLATTTSAEDDALAALATAEEAECFRGSDHDVLARYLGAAVAANADAVVRITGDCPLIDPNVVDEVVDELLHRAEPCDYASNVLRRTFPKGLDGEALHRDVLERVDRLAQSNEAREHVTWFIREERPDLFVAASVERADDWSSLDWSVDTRDDLETIRRIYREYDMDAGVPWEQVARAELARMPCGR